MNWFAVLAAALVAIPAVGLFAQESSGPTTQPDPARQRAIDDLLAGRFKWTASPPLVAPVQREGETCHSVKDPTIVRHKDRWHMFCSIRGVKRSHATEYLGFADWPDAGKAEHHVLPAYDGFWCAPQVFYFTPQKKWYLICQASNDAWDPKYQPSYSTTDDIADVKSWTPPAPMNCPKTPDGKAGLDFWVICDGAPQSRSRAMGNPDDARAHLFFTTLDGRMWRSETKLADFPTGWSVPVVALKGDVFEAGHTYRLKGLDKYLTIIEAQNGRGWRYQKAYLADRLDGAWTELAASKDKAFASMANVAQPGGPGGRWTDSISHGELIRAGLDEKLEVDPADLRFVFQGVLDKDRVGKPYGQIPWRLGLLTPAR